MNPNVFRILMPLVASLLAGCVANNNLAQEKLAAFPLLNLPYDIEEVEVIDSRQNQQAEDIKLPVVSKPNSLIRHVPSFTASHRAVLDNVLRENTAVPGFP
jgi:hypothetical protein